MRKWSAALGLAVALVFAVPAFAACGRGTDIAAEAGEPIPAGLPAAETGLEPPEYRDLDALFRNYRWKKGVISISLGRTLFGMVKCIAGLCDEEGEWKGILRQISKAGVVVMEEDEADKSLREKFLDELDRQLLSYEKALEARDGDERVTLYLKSPAKAAWVEELVVLASDGGDIAVVKLHGRLNLPEIIGKLSAI